jgi:hypothetical protein
MPLAGGCHQPDFANAQLPIVLIFSGVLGVFLLDAFRRQTIILNMATFTPVNSLEMILRTLLADRNTPLWNFYTPLAAAPLWIIIQNHPELDGSDLVAPPGQNPGICIFKGPTDSYIGLYTSAGRAQAAFTQMKISPQAMRIVSAPGYQLLKLVSQYDAHLWINCGLKECQYHLDPDMVEILLSRPEPHYDHPSPRKKAVFEPAAELEQHLVPLRDYFSRQPTVRAVWIYRQQTNSPQPADSPVYEIGLLMDDPEDKSLLSEVGVIAKALTPVEMECVPALLLADDQSLRNLTKIRPPFYARPDFLKS